MRLQLRQMEVLSLKVSITFPPKTIDMKKCENRLRRNEGVHIVCCGSKWERRAFLLRDT
jgi:hypothetical protein